jgi:hypothetical protein
MPFAQRSTTPTDLTARTTSPHPRSAAATRRQGARLTAVDPAAAPRTLAPAGVQATPRAARGIVLYIGLDEEKASQDGTNLTAIAEALQSYAHELAARAETQAVIALAPEGPGRDLDAVRAVATGSPAATGGSAVRHGPLRSRIPAHIRPPRPTEDTEAQRTTAGLRVDIPRREVHIDDVQVNVTTKEFDLLATLVSHPGETLDRSHLIQALWSAEAQEPDERTVDVHVRRLRRRLGDYANVVRTIRGGGYRYDAHPDVEVWSATALH